MATQCVTVRDMAVALREQAQVEQMIDLADAYAAAFVADLEYRGRLDPYVSEESVRKAVAGMLLAFMAEVLSTVSPYE